MGALNDTERRCMRVLFAELLGYNADDDWEARVIEEHVDRCLDVVNEGSWLRLGRRVAAMVDTAYDEGFEAGRDHQCYM
jgi:hypothetical protein